MNTQPLMSFEDRLKDCRSQVRKAVMTQLLIGLPICLGLFALFAATAPGILPLPWWALAPIAWTILALPPVLKSLPMKPDPKDVELDQKLRLADGVE